MGEVVQLGGKKPEKLIWLCNCGCTVHYHNSDGSIDCGACGDTASSLTGEWRLQLPDAPDEPKELQGEAFKLVQLDSAQTFFKRRAKDDVVVVIAINRDGSFATYSEDIDTPDRQAWLDRKLREAETRLWQGR